jgi:short-subunit dehydrogenase
MSKKVAIITGVSSGIGKATAILLSQSGYTVYGCARRAERLQELELYGINTQQVDITDETATAEFVKEIINAESRIDVLVNNAGYGEYGAIEDVTVEKAKHQFEINVFALARMIKKVLPVMREQLSGKIINISSIGGKITSPMGGWYYASKFAVEALSDSLRMEVKPFGIDIIIIEPGGIKTEWGSIADTTLMAVSDSTVYSHFAQKAHRATSLQERLSEPIVIAKVIKKAIEKRHPKIRYVKGFMAKPILFLKYILSDRMFDKVVMTQFK